MRKRFCEYGFRVGFLPIGVRHAISDVPGVRVGHQTIVRGDNIRTGVTVIDPGVTDLYNVKLPAAIAVGNGYGKLMGLSQVEELGTMEAPIALTGTGSVGTVARGIVDIVIATTPNLGPLDSVNAIVGDINDGRVNTLHGDTIQPSDVRAAYDARSADVAIGNVGGGTGARAFSWKGGIGTASRIIRIGEATYHFGVLVQTNFGGAFTILGIPVWQLFGETDFKALLPAGDGSCMIVFATDAPLTCRQLGRIARRAFLGLARTGSVMSHASGDYAIAFTTSRAGLEGSGAIGTCVREADLTSFFLAAVEGVEESVYDALFAAETMQGRAGFTLSALPIEPVLSVLRSHRDLCETRFRGESSKFRSEKS